VKTVEYTYQNGDRVARAGLQIPESSRSDFPSCFLFAFMKGGSVLANTILCSLMAERGVPVVDLQMQLFLAGVDPQTVQCDFTELFVPYGYCFAGFRGLASSMSGLESIRKGRKILVVRDPRDMLVSLYYSMKFSHPLIEERGTPQFNHFMRDLIERTSLELDDYCLYSTWMLNAALASYGDVLKCPDTLVVRYEDFVYDKVHLARSISDWFSLDIPAGRLAELVEPHDHLPSTDQPHAHIRQVHPGDHRRKLKPQTVAALDAALGQFLNAFDYRPAFSNSL
jgi:hypothetical protein